LSLIMSAKYISPGHSVVDLGQEFNSVFYRNRFLIQFVNHVHKEALLSKIYKLLLILLYPSVGAAFPENVDGLGELLFDSC